MVPASSKPKRYSTSFKEKSQSIHYLSYLSLLFSLVLVLAWMENLLPPPPLPVPLRYGLANLAVMCGYFVLGLPSALILTLLKAFFVLMTRGLLAGSLSLSGGLLAFLTFTSIDILYRKNASYFLLSVLSATAHNLGQIFVISFIYEGTTLIFLLPPLLLLGFFSGGLLSFVMKPLLPLFERLKKKLLSTST